MRILEEEFYSKLNHVLSTHINPFYNTFILISAAVFAYFLVLPQNQCYSKEGRAYAMEYSNTIDVTYEFYWLSVAGLIILVMSAILFFL